MKLISRTYRIIVVEPGDKESIPSNKNEVIYVSWHQRFFPAIMFFSKKKPIAAIISRSNDGSIISNMVSFLGWKPVRGSSSKGGGKALKEIVFLVNSGYCVGHAVDGPQGPFGVVKPGVIRIAQLTQVSIIPIIISCSNCWKLNSWDRFMIPKPFAKIIIKFAEPLKVPRNIDSEEFENKRLYLENTMTELYNKADLLFK